MKRDIFHRYTELNHKKIKNSNCNILKQDGGLGWTTISVKTAVCIMHMKVFIKREKKYYSYSMTNFRYIFVGS